jgi:hypothetical protein
MNKRAVILLLICFVLAAATVTLRYIESEKEKIKAQFVPPPRVEPKRVRSATTTAYLSREQPGGEEGVPAGAQPDTVPALQNGTLPPEATQAAAPGEMPRTISPPSQRVEQDALREMSLPALQEDQAVQKRSSALEEVVTPLEDEVVTPLEDEVVTPLEDEVVTPLEDEVVTPLEDEVPVPPEAGEGVQEEETGAEPAEDLAGAGEDADDERGREADADDEEDLFPKPEAEITSGKDEQVPPEEVGEEGEYVEGGEGGEPFEEGLEGRAGEIADEGDGIPGEEEEFPLDGENVLGEGEEVFFDGEE